MSREIDPEIRDRALNFSPPQNLAMCMGCELDGADSLREVVSRLRSVADDLDSKDQEGFTLDMTHHGHILLSKPS